VEEAKVLSIQKEVGISFTKLKVDNEKTKKISGV
jgi:hypothetical protein